MYSLVRVRYFKAGTDEGAVGSGDPAFGLEREVAEIGREAKELAGERGGRATRLVCVVVPAVVVHVQRAEGRREASQRGRRDRAEVVLGWAGATRRTGTGVRYAPT